MVCVSLHFEYPDQVVAKRAQRVEKSCSKRPQRRFSFILTLTVAHAIMIIIIGYTFAGGLKVALAYIRIRGAL